MTETPRYIRDLHLAREADRRVRQQHSDALRELPAPRFAQVFCSSCGQGFGPGDEGFSHCADHAHLQPDEDA